MAALGEQTDPDFRALARLARRMFEVNSAAVTLVGHNEQLLLGMAGSLELPERMPASDAFCRHTVQMGGALLVVEDAREDARFVNHAIVRGAPGLRFYAGAPMRAPDGQILGALCLLDDVPRHFSDDQRSLLRELSRHAASLVALRQTEAELRESEEHHRQAMTLRRQIPWAAEPSGAMRHPGPRIAAIYGGLSEWMQGDRWAELVHPDDSARVHSAWEQCLLTGTDADFEFRLRVADGSYRWFRSQGTPQRDETGRIEHWQGLLEDVHTQHEQAARMEFLASHDDLTGLINRARFSAILEGRLAQGGTLALLSLDVDNLAAVNTTRGHAAGDAVLQEVAARIVRALGEGDVAGHAGGDEFMVLLADTGDGSRAVEISDRVIEAMRSAPDAESSLPVPGVSIGVALSPLCGTDASELLANAALALSRAKAEGRGTFRVFSTGADEGLRFRRALNLDLAHALERGEFRLAFQPQLSAASGRVVSFEALMRWVHPDRGSVPPADFIGLAEETGLIVAMGRFALEQACRAAMNWPAEVRVAVNLSPVQFTATRDLLMTVAAALAGSGLPARRLELEVTESLPLLDDEKSIELLHALRRMGVRIALDDFGSGYSSLAYLQSFPFDKLKVDRSIVSRIGGADAGTAGVILQAVVTMAHALGMEVAAEGVEEPHQAEMLRARGCDQLQGFLFSRPVPIEQTQALIRDLAPH